MPSNRANRPMNSKNRGVTGAPLQSLALGNANRRCRLQRILWKGEKRARTKLNEINFHHENTYVSRAIVIAHGKKCCNLLGKWHDDRTVCSIFEY